MTVDTVPHGTRHGYTRHGCRCQACRDAQAAATRAWRKRVGPRIYNAPQAERDNALAVLRDRHRLEYDEILAAIRTGEVVE